ncbi:response regulator [Paraburkholderia caribensis MBA4]|uniref:Response regulator n=1 Tax=Paraburkholderia caribensis MBA4 TaxID=1323664 RepID=A0A0P0RJT5_9BURK|nr:HD domain-containing phosphohydrolase [Paraburkholderia caribensis]ALL68960.1 response regulator [Paraburkholderia caribensis MBA4]
MEQSAIITLASLALAGCKRYSGASGHLVRTAYMSTCLAALLGLDSREQERIRLVTPVHDIGKLAVSDDVLLKPGLLDTSERRVMERHSTIGAEILSGSADELLQFAGMIARHHHERFDGSGYPDRLASSDIPIAARIVSVADAFDAMTEQRCYRPGMSDHDASSIIVASSGSMFDPDVVAAFERHAGVVDDAREFANDLLAMGDDIDMIEKIYGRRSRECVDRPVVVRAAGRSAILSAG